MIYLGIDPGMTGAVAAVDDDGGCLFYFDVPIQERTTLSGKARRCVDVMTFATMLHGHMKINSLPRDIFAAIEHPALYRPTGHDDRRAGQEKLLMSFAHLEAALWALNIETIEVYPVSWQSYFGLRKQGKEGSLRHARTRWPAADLTKKKHNNRAEALLIAEYGRFIQGGIPTEMLSAKQLAAEPF